MGLKESKFAFLPYEEAVKRVRNDELERIKLAFKRSSVNSSLMPKNAFLNDLLGNVMPRRLAEHLYMACGGGNKGISFKDVVCCLVLITCGTVDEKIKFVFSMISVDGSNVTREDMENFLTACENGSPPTSFMNTFIAAQSERLPFDGFRAWILQNEGFSEVTKWLMVEQNSAKKVRLSSIDDTPSFYQSLEKITKLRQKDLIDLEKRYWYLKSSSVSGKFDIDVFNHHTASKLPKQICDGFFHALDENNDGHVDFKEMVLGVNACCRGSTSDRLSFCFKIFDKDCDGCLSEHEIRMMAEGLISAYQTSFGQEPQLKADDLVNRISEIRQCDNFTKTDFLPWASSNCLIHEFLILLSQICHITFGLRPNSKEEEGFIIRRWIEREERNGPSPDALYYLISESWWNSWKEYVNYQPKNGGLELPRLSQCSATFSHKSSWVNVDSSTMNSSDSDFSSGSSDRLSISSVGSRFRRSGSSSNQIQVESSEQMNGNTPKLVSHNSPGTIDNMALLIQNDNKKQVQNLTGEGGKLKQSIVQGRDFEVLPESVWKALFSWYGGNVALPRTVIYERENDSLPVPELYPIQLHFFRHSPSQRHPTFSLNSLGLNHLPFYSQSNSSSNYPQPSLPAPPKRTLQHYGSFSRKNTVKQVLEFVSGRLKIRFENMRLWDFSEKNRPILIEDETRLLEDCCIKDGHHILIEVRNPDMSWPEEMNSLVATKNFRERSNTGLHDKGATGLHNLGNTCFMNSAIQCISNTYPLTIYFLSKMHLFELNKTNPLGLKGILAKCYGELVYDLWNGMYRSIAPVKLRWTIGKYAPRFNGFLQHDAQELLAFLLDGLHEDLNRVHDKPYIELKDSAGRPDKQVSQEAWENHRKRNQSIIVDLFQGQLKSQVRCFECGNCSVRFDPYTFLSLPIPMENSLHLEIVVFTMNGDTPVKYGLLLCNDASVKTMKLELEKLSGISADHLVIAEIFGALITAFLPDTKRIRENIKGALFAYEVRQQPEFLQAPIQSPSIQRSSLPSETTATTTATTENTRSPNRLTEPAVLGGSPNAVNNLPTKQSRSPRKSRNILPFRRMDKRGNGVVPTQTEYLGTKTMNGNATGISRSPSAELSTECVVDMIPGSNQDVLIALHRKMIQMDVYYLSWQKFRPSLFGIPVLVSSNRGMTRREVYEEVWNQVARFASRPNTETNEIDKGYPFELKMVRKDGNFCACCPWYKYCRGCLLERDDATFDNACSYLAIDWDPTTLHLNYQQGQERTFVDHPSLQESMRLLREPINIDQCLKDFTKEEELGDDETWYCPECKKHQKIAKKFSLWSLPPILIIHLKRFQQLNNRWIKSNKIVKFPMRKFDPSSYLVERDRRKRNPSQRTCAKILNVRSTNECPVETHVSPVSRKRKSDKEPDQPMETDREASCSNIHVASLDLEEIEHMLQNDNECEPASPEEEKYNYRLYAISCHSGMLSGGHYVCYARNPNGKWYIYNDSTCKEVEPSVVENESPYMLFYEREEINISDYLPDIGDNNFDISTDDEEFETDVKKYCVIQ